MHISQTLRGEGTKRERDKTSKIELNWEFMGPCYGLWMLYAFYFLLNGLLFSDTVDYRYILF